MYMYMYVDLETLLLMIQYVFSILDLIFQSCMISPAISPNDKPHPPRYYPGRHNKAEGGIVGSNDSEGRGLHTCIRVMKKIV